MKKISKRYKKLLDLNKDKKLDSVEKIIDTVKNNANAKFIESVDLSFKINLKKIKSSDASLRTAIELPNGSGKKIKVAILCDENKLDEAKKSGAEIFGSDDLIKNITSGVINFDKLICTPSMMSKMGKLGKILGPKGLMPNPKLGTVTDDINKAVNLAKAGQIEIRNDKDGNIGMSIGKKSFDNEMLMKNYNAVIDALEKEKSNLTIKGDLVKQVYITSSMGVSYKIKMDKSL